MTAWVERIENYDEGRHKSVREVVKVLIGRYCWGRDKKTKRCLYNNVLCI